MSRATSSDQLSLFAADSPAKTSLVQGKAQESMPNAAACGGRCGASSRPCDPLGCSLRTSLLSALEELTPFSIRWKDSGTPAGRSWWVLGRWGPRINVTGRGLSLPTPRSSRRGPRSFATALGSLVTKGRTRHHRLEDALVSVEMKNGVPSPRYVEWMMGFPQTWTDLKSSETQSFRRSQK